MRLFQQNEGIMPGKTKLHCSEIIRCNSKNRCRLISNTERPCWEAVKDDSACSFLICIDCLVYLAAEDNPVFSEEEVYAILSKRKARGIGVQSECDLAYQFR